MKGRRGKEVMEEERKNGTDAESGAERCADAYAEFRAVPRAERCAVVRAELRADSSSETVVDFGRNSA